MMDWSKKLLLKTSEMSDRETGSTISALKKAAFGEVADKSEVGGKEVVFGEGG